MKGRVVIIGAGVAGLTTAYRLAQRADIEILVLEKDQVPGGRVRTRALPEGFFADDSAQFLAANYQRTFRLMREIGVYEQLEEIRPDTFSAIYRDGAVCPLPASVTESAVTVTEPLPGRAASDALYAPTQLSVWVKSTTLSFCSTGQGLPPSGDSYARKTPTFSPP